MKKTLFSRRQLLKSGGALIAASTLTPQILMAKTTPKKIVAEKSLKLYNTHTGESFKGPYWAEGSYIEESMQELNKLLRDHRTNDTTAMCRELFDLLNRLSAKLDCKEPFHIISGYRSPKTNEMLRKKNRGVAKKSKHMTGHAVDIRAPGLKLPHLRNAALSEKAGGVGYYPRSNFVHVDIRDRPTKW